jgi:hypothetical protein
MTAKSITFGHPAAVHAAPIEDALTSLIQAGGVAATPEADAKRCLMRAHLRLRATVLNHGHPHLRRARAAADLLIAADLLAALIIDLTLRGDAVFRGLIDVYVPAGEDDGASGEAPILDCEGPMAEMEPLLALLPCDLERDAAQLTAWADAMASHQPREYYGAGPQDGAALVLDTLLAARRGDDELPEVCDAALSAQVISLYAAILGYQLNMRAQARVGSR